MNFIKISFAAFLREFREYYTNQGLEDGFAGAQPYHTEKTSHMQYRKRR